MESMSNMACTKNGIAGDETFICNGPDLTSVVLASGVNRGSDGDFQGLSGEMVHNGNIATSGTLFDQKFANEIPSDYEDSIAECFKNSCDNLLPVNEDYLSSKTVQPTMFENAVKAVKNLFSPAKGHGIFSRSAPLLDINEQEEKKSSDEEERGILTSAMSCLMEQHENKTSLLRSSLDNSNRFLNEETVNVSTVKNSSSTLDPHDNTNDSYTTTVSRIDDSFQSTVTHLDELAPNEGEKSKELVVGAKKVLTFNGSLNRSMDEEEHSLDNTLKKCNSNCSLENGDLNYTFEVGEGERLVANAEEGSHGCEVLGSNFNSGKNEGESVVFEPALKTMDCSESHLPARECGSCPLEWNEKDCSPDGEENSSETVDISIMEIISGKLNELNKSKEARDDLDRCSCVMDDLDTVDEESLSQFSNTNHSSETDCSLYSGKNENITLRKAASPKCILDLEKNFSTSTIVISKADLDRNAVKEELSPKPRLLQTNSEPQINEYLQGYEKSLGPESVKHPSMSVTTSQNKNRMPLQQTAVGKVANSPHGRKQTGKSPVFGGALITNFTNELVFASNELNRFPENQLENAFEMEYKFGKSDFYLENSIELKSISCHPSENTIPLASQKSYTVLHHKNPELNRPVVEHSAWDLETDKLNDIILGNTAFSELSVAYSQDNASELNVPRSSSGTDSLQDTNSFLKVDFGKQLQPNEVQKVANLGCPSKAEPLKVREDVKEGINCELRESMLSLENPKQLEGIDSDEQIKVTEDSIELTIGTSESEEVDAKNKIATEIIDGYAVAMNDCADESRDCEEDVGLWTLTEKELISPMRFNVGDLSKGACVGSNSSSAYFSEESSMSLVDVGEPKKEEASQILAARDGSDKKNVKGEQSKLRTTEVEAANIVTSIANVTFSLNKSNVDDHPEDESGTHGFNSSDACEELAIARVESVLCENFSDMSKEPILGGDADLTQYIQEKFTETDIEKICRVVGDIPELNLSKSIAIASQKFDKSFHDKILNEGSNMGKVNSFLVNEENPLSSACLDFLDSIKGKPTMRDYSRESLYIKFDPLIQKKNSELLDISEGDKENLNVSPVSRSAMPPEPLVSVTPLKQTIHSMSPLSPLTPSSQKKDSKLSTEKLNKLREMQSEILRLREFYLQREEFNKEKMNNYENEIAKLMGKACVLEEKLKESEEMEKSLVKKLTVQNESMNRLKNIVEEYLAHIGKLTDQFEATRMEGQKQAAILREERDYYMNHLQSTEQAFSDVHSKYEKCKKAVEIYKKNEETYKSNIEELKERVEQYSEKVKEIQENANWEVNRMFEKINEIKCNHAQEISRFKAQLRKAELKVQTIQEALDQKIKENQELAGICDELIEGKRCSR